MDRLLEWKQQLMDVLNSAHPALFVAAMIVLPLGPFPASVLFILAGIRFGTALGFGLSMTALAVNMTLGYWMARSVVREPLERWLRRRAYAVPQLERGDEVRFLLLFRVLPGMPLFVQNYVLGLAKVRFGLYLIVSLTAQLPYVLGFVWIGQSLTESSAWKIALAVAAVAAAGLSINLIQRWLRRRRASSPSRDGCWQD